MRAMDKRIRRLRLRLQRAARERRRREAKAAAAYRQACDRALSVGVMTAKARDIVDRAQCERADALGAADQIYRVAVRNARLADTAATDLYDERFGDMGENE